MDMLLGKSLVNPLSFEYWHARSDILCTDNWDSLSQAFWQRRSKCGCNSHLSVEWSWLSICLPDPREVASVLSVSSFLMSSRFAPVTLCFLLMPARLLMRTICPFTNMKLFILTQTRTGFSPQNLSYCGEKGTVLENAGIKYKSITTYETVAVCSSV